MVVNALGALPRQNTFEAYQSGVDARNRNALAGMQQQSAQNALTGQTAQMLAQGVLGASDPAQAYPLALRQAQSMGMDVSQLPQQWGPDAEMMTRMVAMPEAEQTDLQRMMSLLPQDQRRQAAMVHLGLAPKAEGPGLTEVDGTLLRTDPMAGTADPIYTAPEEAPASVQALMERARMAGLREGTPEFREFMLQGGAGDDGMTVFDARGNPIVTTGDPGALKLTEQQGKFALFGTMMDRTMPVITSLERQFDPANIADAAAARLGIPGNFFKSPEYQKYETAGRAWAEGVLRLQTGAAATQPEIERVFQTYFAQPGDTPETVKYKSQLRQAFGESVGIASGGLVQPGADAAERGMTWEQRGAELEAQGVAAGQIVETLISEGYSP